MNYLVTAYKKKERPNRSEPFIEEFDDIDKAFDKRLELARNNNFLKVRVSKVLYEKADF